MTGASRRWWCSSARPAAARPALLDGLAAELDQRVPYARADFAEIGRVGIGQVLDLLAFELNRHCAAYGRLAFPRYIVGRMVMGADLDRSDPDAARARLAELLARPPLPWLRGAVNDVSAGALSLLTGVPDQALRMVSDALLGGVTTFGRRRARLRSGVAWYGHQDRGFSKDPLDTLVELNRHARRPGEGHQRLIDTLLLAAFLADLRADFQRRDHPFDCAVLLDNADTPAGRRFAYALVRERQQRERDAPGAPDPLTVVAASRGSLVELVTDQAAQIPAADQAGPADYRRHRHGLRDERRWWYPVRLPDLDLADVRTMAADRRAGADPARVALAVHAFTRGHPGATDLVLEALAARPEDLPDLRRALERRLPGEHGDRPLRDRLRGRLLGDAADRGGLADTLVTCAAAPDLDQAVRLLDHTAAQQVPRAGVWLPGPEGAAPVMVPVLRTLLLERLAERDPGDPAGWDALHARLRADAAARGDLTGELHHALALGDLKHVCETLADRVPLEDPETWLARVAAVTAAPGRWREAGPPAERIGPLTSWTDHRLQPIGAIALLVAARWVLSDPMGGGERETLHLLVAAQYTALAPFFANGLTRLIREAEHHRDLAELWS
ncbi:hypothetical protein ACFVH6_39800 [Spirillospora sp. NPDC127200]